MKCQAEDALEEDENFVDEENVEEEIEIEEYVPGTTSMANLGQNNHPAADPTAALQKPFSSLSTFQPPPTNNTFVVPTTDRLSLPRTTL